MKWSRLVLATLTLAAHTAVPVEAKEHVVFDFKTGADALKSFNFYGPDAEQRAKSEAAGLRFTLPKGPMARPDGNNVGLDLPYRIRGDFDMVLGYELLKLDGPANGNPAGLGVMLRLEFDTPSPLVVQVTRLQKPPGEKQVRRYEPIGNTGESLGANRMPAPDGKPFSVMAVRAIDTKGRLQLVRTGDKLQYWVTDGDAERYLIRTVDIGTKDVQVVKAVCTSGNNSEAFVDVRFFDLTIEADQFPDGVPAGSGTAASLPPTSTASETPDGRSSSLLIVAGLFAGGLFLFGSIVLMWYLVRMRSENHADSPASPPERTATQPQRGKRFARF